MRQVGIYSGSFNPIHIGHLALANYLCEYSRFDEIWFMVTPSNPWKKQQALLPDDLRLKLVQLSVDGYSRFKASDFEFNLPKPSYTVNTLKALSIAYPDTSFSLIIGADNWVKFKQWLNAEQIMAEHQIYVFPRPDYPIDYNQQLPDTVHLLNTPLLNISSTFIRDAVKEGHDIRFFLHPNAWPPLVDYYNKLKDINH